jgi:hypothetical protein
MFSFFSKLVELRFARSGLILVIYFDVLYCSRQPNLHGIATPIAPSVIRNSPDFLKKRLNNTAVCGYCHYRQIGYNAHHFFIQD